jgi:hypothetical protein
MCCSKALSNGRPSLRSIKEAVTFAWRIEATSRRTSLHRVRICGPLRGEDTKANFMHATQQACASSKGWHIQWELVPPEQKSESRSLERVGAKVLFLHQPYLVACHPQK